MPNHAVTAPDFSWLAELIRRLRPDLCRLFSTRNRISLPFLQWIVTNGKSEYASIAENDDLRDILNCRIPGLEITPLQGLVYLQRKDVRQAYPLQTQRENFVQWFYRHGVGEHRLWPYLSHHDWDCYAAVLPEEAAAHRSNKASAQNAPSTFASRPFGANLIGYAYGQLGIGEDVRMTARALQAAEVLCCILNFPPGADIPQNDFSLRHLVKEEGDYAINIFCMTALETARYFAEKGHSQFKGRYNIGYWPWELAQWPTAWRDLTGLVDEVWVSTRHIYDALAPWSPVPVQIMPLAVDLGEVGPQTRADFGLPEKAYLFCFSFDLNSSIHRKNPEACLKAFQKAFPVEQAASDLPVGLVVKTHAPKNRHDAWERLKHAAASDPRIHIIEETLPRPDLLALYRCCDCYLSLHRAEGFGRGIAEALLLGLHVIATGYSGNVDYCRDIPQADLVGYEMVPVGKGEYPFGTGQQWAEVDVDEAAGAMRLAAESDRATGDRGKKRSGWSFELDAMAKQYEQRLRRVYSQCASPSVTYGRS